MELRRKLSGQDGGEGLDGRMLGWRGCRFGWLHRLRLAALVRMAAQAWMWEAWMREAAASAGARAGRGAGYVGPSVRARRRLVWLGASRLTRSAGREAHLLSASRSGATDGVARFHRHCNDVTENCI